MKIQSNYNSFIFSVSIMCSFIGLGVMAGWIFEIEILKRVIIGFPTMKFNSALCLCLSSIILIFAVQKKYHLFALQVILTLLVFLIAAISFSECVFNYNNHLDQLFVKDYEISNLPLQAKGRMAESTAICFMLMSISFSLLKVNNKVVKIFMQLAFHLVTLIAFIALVGYFYKVPAFYQLSFLTTMAAHTAFSLFLLSIGASLIHPSLGVTGLFTGDKLGSIVTRRIFPPITLLILLLGYLRLESHRLNLVTVEFGIALFAISFLLTTLLIIGLASIQLNDVDKKRKKAKEALDVLNKNLEIIVVQRTAQISEMTQQSIEEKKKQHISILRAHLDGQEKERNHINWELQENVNQILGSAKLFVLSCKDDTETNNIESLKTAGLHIQNAIEEIKKITQPFSSSILKLLGLVVAIKDRLENLTALEHCNIKLTHTGNDKLIPLDIELAIYRIVQEYSTVIIKHSNAQKSVINLAIDKNKTILSIKDDGIYPMSINNNAINNNILANIYARVDAYGKKIETFVENGFSLLAEFDYQEIRS